MNTSELRFWQAGFCGMVLLYALFYSPYGLNDTDSGFITGLAWEVLQGKILYKDLSYVRPPLPVWLRSIELWALPDTLEIRAERWLFYLKMAVTAAGISTLFTQHIQRWPLAIVCFVVSVHCYPPAAWHTVDGVFFAAIGAYFLQKEGVWAMPLAMLAALGSELSKQVFLLTPLLFLGWLLVQRKYRQAAWACVFYAFGKFSFQALLHYQGTLTTYKMMTQGATNLEALWQHGVLDFFQMPWLFWAMLAGFVLLQFGVLRSTANSMQKPFLVTFILLLISSYCYQVYNRQEFTAPFAQARLLWWLGLASAVHALWKRQIALAASLVLCTGINWASAVSWGYNLPVFFPVAGLVGVAGMWSAAATPTPFSGLSLRQQYISKLATIVALVVGFGLGYQFIYRDGRRSEMHLHLGEIYPKLTGIYSDSDTYAKYALLKSLQTKYPHATVLPTMTLANYLQNQVGTLPQQWVVEREFGFASWSPWLEQSRGAVFLVEKQLLTKINADDQYRFTKEILADTQVLEDTEFFLVVQVGKG